MFAPLRYPFQMFDPQLPWRVATGHSKTTPKLEGSQTNIESCMKIEVLMFVRTSGATPPVQDGCTRHRFHAAPPFQLPLPLAPLPPSPPSKAHTNHFPLTPPCAGVCVCRLLSFICGLMAASAKLARRGGHLSPDQIETIQRLVLGFRV
jgi:hypothetical protein